MEGDNAGGHGLRCTLQEGKPHWDRDNLEGLQPVKVPHQGSNTGKPGETFTRKQRTADKKHETHNPNVPCHPLPH